jgi:ribosomal protein S8
MVEKGTVRVTTTNITKKIGRILLREGFIEDIREHHEGKTYFFDLNFQILEKEEKDIYDHFKAYQQIWFEN